MSDEMPAIITATKPGDGFGACTGGYWAGEFPGQKYVKADDPKALASAMLELWEPANFTQMTYPEAVPLRRYLKAIAEQQ